MSSLKNAMKSQRTHRERHQPESRKNLGLLEKKKDYKQRARDYNEKKETIKKLRKRALDKNPDEFYHHMINSEMKDGVHREKGKEVVLTPEQVKLMQTQDVKYVIHKRTIEKKKIEKLKARLHLLDVKPQNTHTFFVDSEKEKKSFDVAKRLETHPALLGRTQNRLKLSDLKKMAVSSDPEDQAIIAKLRHKSYKELRQRIDREQQLAVVQEKMEIKKHLANKNEKPEKIISPETESSAAVIKWPTERKR